VNKAGSAAQQAAADSGRALMRTLVTRSFFVIAALALLASSALTLLVPQPAALALQREMALMFALLAAISALCLRLPQRSLGAAMTAVLTLTMLAIAWVALRMGWGMGAPGLAAYGLLVCVLCAAAGVRAGALLAGVAAACLVAIFALLPTAGAEIGLAPTPLLRLSTHLLLVAAGLATGAMTHAVVVRYMRSAQEREQRFRSLLGLAADAYWEIDKDYRLVTAAYRDDDSNVLTPAGGLGAVPWELPRFGCDADTLDALQADLDAREPFRDLAVSWSTGDGENRLYRVSGEPRFNARGVFTGYWGVARDVTADVAAREALAATETRYQELFARAPTPLVLHRNGRLLDANPAALQLFGQNDLAMLVGRDLLSFFESGDSRERARRRAEELLTMEPGAALPVADFRLVVRDRLVSVRATGVRVMADGAPAQLSIFIDVTDRRAAEEAVRRSEAMLSHLVATSPDLISLTDLDTGRYAMVNEAYERLLGHSAPNVIGRTSLELGIWVDPADRAQLVDGVRKRGSVANVPMRLKTRAGKTVQLLLSASSFVMDQRDFMVVIARDVTESERARLEREAILENASVGIAVTRDQRFVLANPAFEQMFGWPPGSLLGEPGRVVWKSVEDYQELGAQAGPVLARGELFETERQARRRDGSSFLARVNGRAIDPSHPAHGGTVWMVEDVTQQREFERALARARDDAEAASRAKSAFLANTSHELRTPLNGMIGLAQLARVPDVDEQRRREYLDQIAESAQSLADIIADILDLSKIEAGKLQLETTAFDLGDLLRALQRAYSTLTLPRRIALDFDIASDAQAVVAGDPVRVRQILSNYLSNALKFTAQGSVRLSARRVPGSERVRFEVHDTGPGIDTGTQDRLFSPFTQADESTTRRYGGTGLGLSICRELAQLMGGTVGVDSELGRGSCFWAELPLPAAELPAAPAEAADEHLLRGARVLLVEDNPVNMMIAAAMLERWGVQVEQATDGGQAVEAVGRAANGRAFDAVLMDVQMPVMSGHEATRVLRASAAARGLPIIALTAAALVTERQEAMDAGMNDFLTKPIDASKLRATLARWIGRS
jgi:PAS domain S-box-containing protein